MKKYLLIASIIFNAATAHGAGLVITATKTSAATTYNTASVSFTGVPAGALLVATATAECMPQWGNDLTISSSPALTWTSSIEDPVNLGTGVAVIYTAIDGASIQRSILIRGARLTANNFY